MPDCELFGAKHKLKIHKVVDHFLMGHIVFKCVKCTAYVIVDRLYLYLALKTEVRRLNGN